MQIYSLNLNNKSDNKIPCKNTTKNSLSFDGALTRLAEKSPNVSPGLMRAMNGIYKRDKGIVGVFPPEFVASIKTNLQNTNSSKSISQCIQETKDVFAEVARLFNQIEKSSIANTERQIQKINFNKYIKLLREKLQIMFSPNYIKSIRLNSRIKKRTAPDKKIIKDIEKKASLILENGLNHSKVISENTKVIVKRLDDGKIGTAYKISFIDRNHNKLFKDKVIKYYKNLNDLNVINIDLALKEFELVKGNYDKAASAISKMYDILIKRGLEKGINLKEAALSQIAKFRNTNRDEYISILKERFQKQLPKIESVHGVNKEANIGNYVRKNSGHGLQHSDLIEYFYTDLNNNYALLDFSDSKTLGPISKVVDYESLGVRPEDNVMLSKFYNYVDGRMIDYGGFKVSNQTLANNKVARRVYKIIKHINLKDPQQTLNARILKYNEIYSKAIDNAISQSSDVILGLNEARALIPENKQYLLYGKNNL